MSGVYVGTVPTSYGKSICFPVKLDRTSAPLSERNVVMVISPLVSLSEAIFKVLVCLFDVQCHSLWKEPFL